MGCRSNRCSQILSRNSSILLEYYKFLSWLCFRSILIKDFSLVPCIFIIFIEIDGFCKFSSVFPLFRSKNFIALCPRFLVSNLVFLPCYIIPIFWKLFGAAGPFVPIALSIPPAGDRIPVDACGDYFALRRRSNYYIHWWLYICKKSPVGDSKSSA